MLTKITVVKVRCLCPTNAFGHKPNDELGQKIHNMFMAKLKNSIHIIQEEMECSFPYIQLEVEE